MGKKIYSSLETIQEYFQRPDLDQTSLKKLLLGPTTFFDEREKKLYFEESESYLIGSLVDCKLTNKEEDFDKQFYVSTLTTKPSDVIMSIIRNVYDSLLNEKPEEDLKELSDYPDYIHEIALQHNYQPGYKADTRILKILEHSYYFEELKKCNNRKILSEQETSLADFIIESLKSNKKILGFLDDFETNTLYDNWEAYFQYPVYFTYNDVKCKGLMDIFLINRKRKQIRIIDIKTTALNTLVFYSAVMKYRYDIQIAFYSLGVKANFPDYDIYSGFAVESTTKPGNPIYYNASEDLINQGIMGREPVYSNNVLIKGRLLGIDNLIKDYKYYIENGFNRDRILVEKDSVLTLSTNGIVTV